LLFSSFNFDYGYGKKYTDSDLKNLIKTGKQRIPSILFLLSRRGVITPKKPIYSNYQLMQRINFQILQPALPILKTPETPVV